MLTLDEYLDEKHHMTVSMWRANDEWRVGLRYHDTLHEAGDFVYDDNGEVIVASDPDLNAALDTLLQAAIRQLGI